MPYRVSVLTAEPTPAGGVRLTCQIQRQAEAGEWVTIADGTRPLLLTRNEVLDITGGPGTDAQKRAALVELFRTKAQEWQLHYRDEACADLMALIPGALPIQLNL